MKTALYLHSKHTFPKVIDVRQEFFTKKLTEHYGEPVKVITARTIFEQKFTGDWDSWCRSLPYARNATTRKPMYDIFVTDMQVFPRATTTILDEALLPGVAGKRSTLDAEGKLQPVPLDVFSGAPGLPLRKLSKGDLVIIDWDDYAVTASLRDEAAEESSDEEGEE